MERLPVEWKSPVGVYYSSSISDLKNSREQVIDDYQQSLEYYPFWKRFEKLNRFVDKFYQFLKLDF